MTVVVIFPPNTDFTLPVTPQVHPPEGGAQYERCQSKPDNHRYKRKRGVILHPSGGHTGIDDSRNGRRCDVPIKQACDTTHSFSPPLTRRTTTRAGLIELHKVLSSQDPPTLC